MTTLISDIQVRQRKLGSNRNQRARVVPLSPMAVAVYTSIPVPLPVRSRKAALAANSLAGVLNLLVGMGIAFVMSPVIVRGLGVVGYGVWEVFGGIVGYMGLLEVGIGPAVVRYVARASGEGNLAAVRRVFFTGLAALSAMGAVGATVVLSLSPWAYDIANVTPADVRDLGKVLAVLGVGLFLSLVNTALSAFLIGLQHQALVNAVRIPSRIAQAAILYQLLHARLPSPVLAMALVSTGGAALEAITLFLLGRRRLEPGTGAAVDLATAREMAGFGVKNAILTGSGSLLRQMITVVIAQFVGAGSVVFYAVPNRLVEYAQSLGLSLGYPLMPFYAQSTARPLAEQRAEWMTTTRVLQAVTLGTPLALVWYGEPFTRRWMGPEIATASLAPLLILSLGLAVQGLVATNASRMVVAMGRHGALAAFSSVFAPLMLLVACGGAMHFGVAGVAAASAIQSIGTSVFEVSRLRTLLGISPTMHVLDGLRRAAGPWLATCAVALALRYATYPLSYGQILAQASTAGAVYVTTAYLLSLTAADRAKLRSLALGLAGRNASS
jgi:O-antigen/teichoic acid export membrane protein